MAESIVPWMVTFAGTGEEREIRAAREAVIWRIEQALEGFPQLTVSLSAYRIGGDEVTAETLKGEGEL